jgi:hypothetical protein
MIRANSLILTATLSLIMSAYTHTAEAQSVTAQVAKVPSINISSLPFNITAPGTYVLTGNLNFASANSIGPAIIISAAVTGPVVLDLKGFTIIGIVDAIAILIGQTSSTVPNSYPITIRNGTFQNFGLAIRTYATTVWTDITVNNIVFDNISGLGARGIVFANAQCSTISNCTFNGCDTGIFDTLSQGGNIYINNTFLNSAITIQTSGGNGLTLNRYVVAPPPSN